MEQTLVILKPDAVQRGILGEIITRFERVGLKLVAAKIAKPTKDEYFYHYENIGKMISRRGEVAFKAALEFMQTAPIMIIVFEGVEAVSLVRKMVGVTEPKASAPGTIRGDYAHMSFDYANPRGIAIPNLIHASGNLKEAKQEIKHWFKKEELFNYESALDKFNFG